MKSFVLFQKLWAKECYKTCFFYKKFGCFCAVFAKYLGREKNVKQLFVENVIARVLKKNHQNQLRGSGVLVKIR